MKFSHHIFANKLQFTAFSSDDIRKLSVARIVTPISFDVLGNALPGGLYDPALGPYATRSDPCTTCGQTIHCIGHSGHIELNLPTFNPVFIKTVYTIIRITCLNCFRLQIPEHIRSILELQLKLVDAGYEIEAQDLEIYKSESVANSSNYTIKTETGGDRVHPKIAEYMELLQKVSNETDSEIQQTKNTQSLRTAIVSSAVDYTKHNKCIYCKAELKKIKYAYKKLVITIPKADVKSFYQEHDDKNVTIDIKSTNKAIFADECRKYFRQLYENHAYFLKLVFPILQYCSKNIVCPTDIFFMDVILVPSSIIRPANKIRNEITEHPQTISYKNVLKANSILKAILINLKEDKSEIESDILSQSKPVFDDAFGNTPYEKLYNAWQTLQTAVDQVLDITMGKDPIGIGLKQIIEKKDGIIRMHMMGKRVNYAARTVITPDPYINVDEIGVPDVFSKKLSYPTPVTTWNVTELRKMVINGPDVHPGANFIEDEKGNIQLIPINNVVKRESMAKTLLTYGDSIGTKIVHRHLMNGDILLLNRQPTLHRPSIMAHKARILHGEKTFRLHYSNCKAYNADFDGDEMNAHFPQNELARSEGYNLVNVANQYLVPKDGTPLGGLIQDHIISGVKLTTRGRFFNREDYQKLVYIGLSHLRTEIKILPPAIIKPFQLWSGKQILSTIIINIIPKNKNPINLKSTAKINDKAWQTLPSRNWLGGGTPLNYNEMSEAEVIIRYGELLVGVLDKTHYGATTYGLIHCMYELYGGNCSTQLLTSFSKLFTVFMQHEGFTLGVHDILVVPEADRKRKKIIKKCRKIGNSTVASLLDLPEDIPTDELAIEMQEAYIKDPKFRNMLDRRYKSALDTYTNSINSVCLPLGLLSKFPDNNLQLMVASGAKGSTVNTMQISSLLGQIELEGKRPPLMISGKSLPSFALFETSPKSGGFIDGRFLTGIQPQDFFFHCMAGREGLIDTAVKTSRSGYLQRCLIKHLEGLTVDYDMTVRDSDKSVIQFLYGEDGMDISKAQFLKTKQLSFLDDNSDIIANSDLLDEIKNNNINYDDMLRHIKKLKSWIKRNGQPIVKKRMSNFNTFSKEICADLEIKNPFKIRKQTGRRKIDEQICKLWMNADENQKYIYSKKCRPCPDPVNSKYKSNNYFGSIPEYLDQLINGYVKVWPKNKQKFREVMSIKSMQSLVEPGEPVGLLAAQSIGEPSTQMTLNTFHFAGRGEMNVTLGIPRLREILMLASSNIKTPSMDIPFLPNKNIIDIAEKLRLKLIRVSVADVLESINITSELITNQKRIRAHTLRFNFLPRDAYKEQFFVKPKQIINYMTNKFFKIMFRAIMKAASEKHTVVDVMAEDKKDESQQNNDDKEIDEKEPSNKKIGKSGDSSDDEQMDDDDDATNTKLKKKNMDENDYEEPDVDEEKEDANPKDLDNDEADKEYDTKSDENDDDEEPISDRPHESAENYKYDKVNYLWCQVTFHLNMKYKNLDLSVILREVANKAIIVEVPNIRRAITYNQNNEIILKTDGINVAEMFKYNKILNLNRLYTNDIHSTARTYGIEAASRVIVREVQNVFKVYGITVDPRHLLLIADYMTFDGTFKPLSRSGMVSSASPIQQMTFESSLQFLKGAIIAGRCDQLENPSSRIMVGQPCKSGTGSFTLLTDGSFYVKEFLKK